MTTDELVDEDIDWAYCHNPACQISAAQVFHPIDETPQLVDPETGRRLPVCGCPNTDHPHQQVCQCGVVMRQTRPTN